MASSVTQRRLRQAGRLSKNGSLFISTVILFMLSLGLVFFGFIGYVSRVSLSSEFQKTASQDIDYIFMILDQAENDEVEISKLRVLLVAHDAEYTKRKADAQWAGWRSSEFKAFFDGVMELVGLYNENEQLLAPDYLMVVRSIDPGEPSFEVGQLLTAIRFRIEIPDTERKKFGDLIASRAQVLKTAIFNYVSLYTGPLVLIRSDDRSIRGAFEFKLRHFLSRNPQLASGSEIADYKLEDKIIAASSKPSVTDQQRAIIRSYKKALFGWGGTILAWPTIVSTMIVTLAMGLLGSIVSFMGTAMTHPHTYRFSELFRRSILGITAALGIFLFAGSGLLVLTAQSGKPVGAGSIELSPYFVAFLAFISGFLADDAAARLTRAGRAIFQADQKGARGGAPRRTAKG